MEEQHGTIERRTLLKLIGAAGASATVMSAGRTPWGTSSLAHASGVVQSDIESFEFYVSDDELEDLRRRLASPRWPADPPGEPWAYGTDRAYLQELVSYWKDRYDWRKHETELNAFDHYTTTIEGQLVHFVHHEGRGVVPAAVGDDPWLARDHLGDASIDPRIERSPDQRWRGGRRI